MGFFSNVGKALGKVANVAGNVLKTAGSVASVIPGVGAIVGAGATMVGSILSPDKEEKIVQAVAEQKVVKTAKIEQTIVDDNPDIDAVTLQAATTNMTKKALAANPTAKVDDSGSLTNIPFTTKAIQWIKSNLVLVCGGAIAAYFLFFKKGGRRRGW